MVETHQLPGFIVEDLGERHRQRLPVPVVLVGESVDHCHGARQLVLERPVGEGAQVLGVFDIDGLGPGNIADNPGHIGVVALPDLDGGAVLEIHAVEAVDEGHHEVAPGLLSVGHDIEPGLHLVGDHQSHRVTFGGFQLIAFEAPFRPQLFRVRQPRRLGQASGNCALERHDIPLST